MRTTLDEARELRQEDSFDAARLDAYLKDAIPGLAGEPVIRQFLGGASNLTYLVSYGDHAMVLRRPPPGATGAGAHDMLREAAVMAALRSSYPYVPAILARCDDTGVLGTPFYVMERLQGMILRRELPELPAFDAAGARRLCETFIDRLIDLHAVDTARPEVAAIGKGQGYVERQVGGWTGRWERAATPGVDPCADVVAWLRAMQPARESRLCVIHNDYRLDNVVLDAGDPQRIIGVLDWEMATIGDPMMDLGGALAYWVEAGDDAEFRALRRQPSHAVGMMTRREVIEYYEAGTGADVWNFTFYEVFGLFRLMVIAQQIYRRYVLGQTTNEQFAGFGDMVRTLGLRCRRLIDADGSLR